MKYEHKIIVISVLIGLIAGFLDAVTDTFIFQRGTFIDLLFLKVPRFELYFRGIILLSFTAFGLIISRYVSKIRRAKEELREGRDRLEVEVAERTAELQRTNKLLEVELSERIRMEEELLKARKIESIGVLAGGIAHDFNNLLTGILNCISLAKTDTKPDDSTFEALAMAEKAARQAKALTSELFTFAKIGEPDKKSFVLPELIKDVVSFSLSGSNVKYELYMNDTLWPVMADKGHINRVVHNLVINAMESMPEGGAIVFRAQNTTIVRESGIALREGNYIQLSVEDNGPGIPQEHMHKIFDPYFTTKKRGNQRGKGLGLAICYSIIKNNDGHIMANSTIGTGTTFTLYLPFSQTPPDVIESDRKI